MVDSGPPERDIKDFSFKINGKVRLFSSPPIAPRLRTNLLAVSNKYGFIFSGTPEGCRILLQTDLSRKFEDVDKISMTVEDIESHAIILTPSPPSHVALSSDDLTLAVCIVRNDLIFALMYDVRSFVNKGSMVAPFMEVRLSSSPSVELLDFSWNPGADFASMFACCTSDGCLCLFEVASNLRIIASLPSTTAATALCWSPKGKQVVVGKANGGMMQLDQQLKLKKEIPCPPVFQTSPMSVIDVLWQSTHVFMSVYGPANGDTSEPPCMMVVTVPKGENPSFVRFDDICYGSGEERRHKYYLLQVAEWEVVLTASANALEAAVLGKHPDQKTLWERWILEDSGRAELPLTEDYRETMPSGIAISLSSLKEIPMGDNMVHPASPLLLLLSTDGLLIVFHMISSRPAHVSLVQPAEALTIAGMRPALPAPTVVNTSQPAAAIQLTTTGIAPVSPASKSVFGSISLGQKVSTPTKGFTFSTPTKGFTFGDKLPATTTPSSLFNLPARTPSTAGTTNSGGQASTGQTTSTAFIAAPPAGQPISTAFSAASPAGQPTSTAFSAAPPAGQPTSTAFSAAPPAGQPTSTAFSAAPPAGQPTSTAFGAASISQPPSFSLTQTDTPSQTLLPSMQHAGQPPPSFSFKPATTAAVSAAPVSVVKPSPSPAPPVVHPAVTSSSAFSINQSTPGIGGKRSQDSSSLAQPNASTASPFQPTRQTLKPQTVTKKSAEAPAKNPFNKSITDEVMHFNQELADLAKRCSRLENVNVGSEESKENLCEGTVKMSEFGKDIKDTMHSLNTDSTLLKTSVLEGFSLLESIQIRQHRENEPAYKELLRSRALDPASARLMKNINSQFHYLESSIRNIDLQLDAEWEQYQRTKNRAKKVRTPATDALYHTLRNNHNILHGQAYTIEKLEGDLKRMRLYNSTSGWHVSMGAPTGDSPQLSEIGAPPRRMSSPLTPSAKVSPEKQARLREALSKRRVTPVKSTAPGNLSMSKIVSATNLRRMLGDEEDPSDASQNRLPQTFVPKKEVQQLLIRESTVLKSPPGSQRATVDAPTLTSLLKSPNSTLKPIARPGEAVESWVSPLPAPKPLPGASPTLQKGPLLTSLPVAGITIGQSQSFKSDFPGNGAGERPSDPAAKVISQTAPFTKASIGRTYAKPSDCSNSNEGLVGLRTSKPASGGVPLSADTSKFAFNTPSAAPHSNAGFSFGGGKVDQPPPFEFKPSSNLVGARQASSDKLSTLSGGSLTSGTPVFGGSAYSQVTKPATQAMSTVSSTVGVGQSQPPVPSSVEPFAGSDEKASQAALLSTASPVPASTKPGIFGIVSALSTNQSFSTSANIISAAGPQPPSSMLPAMTSGPSSKPISTDTVTSSKPPSGLFGAPAASSGQLFGESSFSLSTGNKERQLVDKSAPDLEAAPASTSRSLFGSTSSGTGAKFPFDVSGSINKENNTLFRSTTTPASEAKLLFGGNAPVTATSSDAKPLFGGNAPVTATSSEAKLLLGGNAPVTATSSEAKPLFGGNAPVTATSSEAKPLFGGNATVSTTSSDAKPLFGGNAPVTATSSDAKPLFGGNAPVTATSSDAKPLFGGIATGTAEALETKTLFGGSSAATTVPSEPKAFFSQSLASPSLFPASSTQSSSVFGTHNSGNGFGEPVAASGFGQAAFGQNSSTGFGLQPNQSLLGEGSNSSAGTSMFGSPASTPLAPAAVGAALFGTASASSTSGGFFSGLGGKPSIENANKNVFGSTSFSSTPTPTNSGVFVSSVATSSGSTFGGGGGPFSGGNSTPGTFSGFGSAASTNPAASGQIGSFGVPSSFGGNPAFSSPPSFGGTPAFGSSPGFGSPISGTVNTIGETGGFASFASSNVPTFGGIAQQPSSPTFGSVVNSGFSAASGTFGSPANTGTVFGSSSPAQPSFGGQQQSSFGGLSGPTSPGSSFTSYRS